LPAGTRISLNSDLHDALEARGAEVTRLVHHAIEGGDDEALLRSVPRAVEIAVSVGSYREARRHLMSIEHLLGHLDDLQRAALLNTWATAEDALGNIGKAMELRLRAIELYETAGSKTRLAECVQRLPVLQARMKLPEAARETAALAVELARSSGNPNVLSRALSDFAEIHAMHRYMGESRVAIAEALDVANDDMTRAYALAMELWTMASGAMALQKIPEALALARRSGSLLAERVIHVVRVLCG
jgi:tetratricopeptide (TPR) repeat protein